MAFAQRMARMLVTAPNTACRRAPAATAGLFLEERTGREKRDRSSRRASVDP